MPIPNYARILPSLAIEHGGHVSSPEDFQSAYPHATEACRKAGVEVFIAAARGAAHLAGVVAAKTLTTLLHC